MYERLYLRFVAIKAVVIASPLQLFFLRVAFGAWFGGKDDAKVEWWGQVLSVVEAVPLMLLMRSAFSVADLSRAPLATAAV